MTAPVKISSEAWAALGSVLSRELIVLTDAARIESRNEWEAVTQAERDLDDRLTVGLVGGTGVGKSTLINALAGREVSQAGDRRPTTNRVIAYRHRATTLPETLPRSDLAEPEVCHEMPALERVILLDFPDFDSVEELHHEILGRYYPHLDVLIVLVDDVKYADARLFELLRRLPQSSENLHGVLNKIDKLALRYPDRWRAVADEMLDDFSSKLHSHLGLNLERQDLLAISARNALRNSAREKPGANEETGDFDRLTSLVEGYRVKKRRRRAKELNLEARQAALAARVRDLALDTTSRDRIHHAVLEVRRRRGEIDRVLAGISPAILSAAERRRWASNAVGRFAGKLGFPIDMAVALAGQLSWRSSSNESAAVFSGGRVREHYASYAEALRNLCRELKLELDDLMRLAAFDVKEESCSDAAQELERRVSARLTVLSHKSRWRNHALPGGVAALFLWSTIYPGLAAALKRLGGEEGASWSTVFKELFFSAIAALSPWSIGGVVLAILAAYAVTALLVWGRRIQGVAQAITETEDDLRGRIQATGSSVLDAALGSLERWQRERAELARCVGENSASP